MDISSAEWFCEMNDAAIMNEWPQMLNTLDNFYCSSSPLPLSPPLSFLTPLGTTSSDSVFEKPVPALKRPKPDLTSSPGSSIISFGDSSSKLPFISTNNDSSKKDVKMKTSCSNRSGVQAQDHVFAERKRRERLTQCFISLSSLVPGLKKLDKASVIGGAIKHIKDLEERVKELETAAAAAAGEPPAAVVKRIRLSGNDGGGYSSDENSDASTGGETTSLPEIEVRSKGQDLLISVHCMKINGVIKEMISEIEKINLSILSSSVVPFGKNTIHITIVAQMDHNFCMTTKDVANNIRMTILKFTRCDGSN